MPEKNTLAPRPSPSSRKFRIKHARGHAAAGTRVLYLNSVDGISAGDLLRLNAGGGTEEDCIVEAVREVEAASFNEFTEM